VSITYRQPSNKLVSMVLELQTHVT